MKASEILELVRAGYTRAEIEQMNDETPPAPAVQKVETPPALQQETPPAQKVETPTVPSTADEQHMELMKAIAGLTAAVQMQNLVQSGTVGAVGGMSAEKALALGTFGGGMNNGK